MKISKEGKEKEGEDPILFGLTHFESDLPKFQISQ